MVGRWRHDVESAAGIARRLWRPLGIVKRLTGAVNEGTREYGDREESLHGLAVVGEGRQLIRAPQAVVGPVGPQGHGDRIDLLIGDEDGFAVTVVTCDHPSYAHAGPSSTLRNALSLSHSRRPGRQPG